MQFRPPHQAIDEKKLQSMIDHLNNNCILPPVVVIDEIALTGSHRLQAWSECEIEPNYIEIDEELYTAAVKKMDLDPIYDHINDYNELCYQLYNLADCNELKSALEDQF
jgi:hypothetical protein